MAGAVGNRYSFSGFEETFVNEVDEDYHCAICKFPAKEPVQTRCGHRFCKGCMEENMRRYAGHAWKASAIRCKSVFWGNDLSAALSIKAFQNFIAI